jgi:starch synthase
VLESIKHIDFKPDIIHFNDWHTGMLALLYHDQYKHQEGYEDIKFVYTIHNLKYQGIFNKHVLHDLLGLKGDYYHKNGVEFYGNVNFMKAGIVYSDITTTVSKTYANEITYPYFGYKLDGLLRAQGNKLVGIVNGIDYDSYNPATDDKIYENYTVDNYQENKVKNKLALQREMGLEENPDIPLIGIVTRLTEMKGLSLIRHIFDELMQLDLQLVLLGTGEEGIENAFRYFESQYPEKARSNIMFSNEMAHKIYAASDLYLMPSKFEPCGLSQLIALRYGTIPIVRETGGLNDTVEAYNIYTGEGNGFSFKNYNAHELLFTIKRALALYHNEKDKWHSLVEKALKSDNSWKHSAEEYLQLYNRL